MHAIVDQMRERLFLWLFFLRTLRGQPTGGGSLNTTLAILSQGKALFFLYYLFFAPKPGWTRFIAMLDAVRNARINLLLVSDLGLRPPF